ncbi:LPXTG cell wall anchor domain-containing protein [Lactococcus allomyrinae]|uniref:LPXTG cell wall anchor domain-containing protein n=1 Tax=Lactococcus allomyrinae TaxID=2419773 RepID=A0A387BCW1_9LACT|nr:LPXTG cell wall anchor domain-containing protein [Lactococcus allomyrinae]AYG01725.1 LPXTG cell wall anchor domain-containing protein [Lactococcus allomyrinae]
MLFLTIRRNTPENRTAMVNAGLLNRNYHNTSTHQQQDFIWQKYTVSVTQQEEDLFTFVSYSTAVLDEWVYDISFATMTFMEGATFGEEGDFELLEQEPPPPEEDNGNGDNGNGTPPNGDNGQNNNGDTPPNRDNEQNGSGKDNENENINDGAEDNNDSSANGGNDTNVNDLITGAENVDLPQTGTATSALGLAGLATLGIAATTLVGKKRNKDRKNTKK